MLNIDAIHMREINMPLAHPFETSFGLTTGRRILLIELESDGLPRGASALPANIRTLATRLSTQHG